MVYNRHLNIKKIEKSMANGRKIFRFLKFVEDLKKFISIISESSFDIKTVLKAFICLSGCFYHFLDNLVWASNVGIINRVFTGEINWKTSKNFFSQIRIIIKLLTAMMEFKTCYFASSENNENEIKNENFEKIINETIKNRAKLRMLTVDILHHLLKMCMLLYSSKIQVFYSMMHPIIISFFGVLVCCISIFKFYIKINEMQKKILNNYKKSDGLLKNETNNNYDNIFEMKLNKIYVGNSQQNIYNSSQGNVNGLKFNIGNKIKSFELSLIERLPNQELLTDENYFDNYYIDFNKDFPIFPEMVLNSNGGEFTVLN